MRISYFDFLRGVAIIMVVFIHCLGRSYSYSTITLPVIAARNLMNVAVPLFLAISGYFLASKQMENGGYASFLKKQIPRVYIPMLFCSLAYLFVDLKNGSVLGSALKYFSCSYSVYYFVAVIIQCYLLLWFLQKHVSKKMLITLFIAGFAWWGLNTYYIGIYMEKSLPLILLCGNFIPWIIFFVMGMSFRRLFDLNNTILYKIICGGVFVFMILSVAESRLVMDNSQSLKGLGQKASVFCLNVILCIVAFHNTSRAFITRYENNKFYRLICLVGRYSFGIYLIHLFTLGYICKVWNFISIPSISWFVSSISVTLVCLLILMICKRVFPKISWILLGV